MEGEADLEEILNEMGGGFYMSTRVNGVPKGSGLGTSSILSGACVRALGEFLGADWSDSDVYELVLFHSAKWPHLIQLHPFRCSREEYPSILRPSLHVQEGLLSLHLWQCDTDVPGLHCLP